MLTVIFSPASSPPPLVHVSVTSLWTQLVDFLLNPFRHQGQSPTHCVSQMHPFLCHLPSQSSSDFAPFLAHCNNLLATSTPNYYTWLFRSFYRSFQRYLKLGRTKKGPHRHYSAIIFLCNILKQISGI